MTQRFARRMTQRTTRRPACEALETRGLLSAGLSSPDAAGLDRVPEDLQGSSVIALDYEGQIGDLAIRAQNVPDTIATDGADAVSATAPEPASAPLPSPMPSLGPDPAPSLETNAETDIPIQGDPIADSDADADAAGSEMGIDDAAQSAAAIAPTSAGPNPLANLLNNSTVRTYSAAASPSPSASAPAPTTVTVAPFTPAPRGAAALFQQIFKGQVSLQGRWTPVLKIFDAGKEPQVQVWKVKVADPPAAVSK